MQKLVGPGGIVPAREAPQADRGMPESFRGEQTDRREVVTRIFPSWNSLGDWLRRIEGLRLVA